MITTSQHQQQQQPNNNNSRNIISTIQRHYLVVGTKTALKMFCHFPSQCTGISPSADWARLHQAWADRSARGLFQYSLSTGGGHVSVSCVDFSCVAPSSGNSFSSGESIQALIRPFSLSRQMVPTPLFSQNGNNNQNQNQNAKSNDIEQNSFQNSSAVAQSTNDDDQDHENNFNKSNNNQPGMTKTMPSKSGTKHSHLNAYVVSTIFVLIEMYDAQTLNMASSSLKILDDQCQLLNANHGNIPQIVFVALNVERDDENNNDSDVPSFPEVLIDDVIELSKRLRTAKGRVDEVTLLM